MVAKFVFTFFFMVSTVVFSQKITIGSINVYSNGKLVSSSKNDTINVENKNNKEYYNSGALKKEIIESSEVNLEKYYYENGALEYEYQSKDSGYDKNKITKKEGFYVQYHQSGVIEWLGQYLNDHVTGEWKGFHLSGEKKWSVNYEKGKRQGAFLKFYENGQLAVKGLFDNDKKNGKEIHYSENGEVKYNRTYDQGKVINIMSLEYKGKKRKPKYTEIKPSSIKAGDLYRQEFIKPFIVPDSSYYKASTSFEKKETKIDLNNSKKELTKSLSDHFIKNLSQKDIFIEYGLKKEEKVYVMFEVNEQGKLEFKYTSVKNQNFKNKIIDLINSFPPVKPEMAGSEPIRSRFVLPLRFN